MEYPFITASAAFVLSIILVILSMRVSIMRQKVNVDFGVGGDLLLERAVRAHGNLTESAPLFLILLTLLEMRVGDGVLVLSLAGVFVIGRVIGLLGSFAAKQIVAARIVTMMASNLSLLAVGIMLIRDIF
ncbi:MAG: MAPEG family protein [Alphaproteobacteria bacterium]|nr:MAPEG family protein [Alphaproteobacteria bacterium]